MNIWKYLKHILTFFLTFYLAFFLALYLAFYLAFCLALYLALVSCWHSFWHSIWHYHLAFYLASGIAHCDCDLAVEVRQCTRRLRSGRLQCPVRSRAGDAGGWGLRLRAELAVGFRQRPHACAHCDRDLAAEIQQIPAVPTLIESWQLRSGSAHCGWKRSTARRKHGGGRRRALI